MKKLLTLLFILCFAYSSYATDIKITEFTADATPTTDDLLVTVDSPGASPVTKKATIANVLGTNLISIRALSLTEGGILWNTTTTALATSALLAQYGVMIGGGIDAAPSTISAATTTTHALFATAGAPAFRAIASEDIPDLSATYQPLDAQLTSLAALAFTDVSMIQANGTGFELLTLTANQLVGANAGGTALEGKSSISVTSITDSVKWICHTDATKTVTFDLETNLDTGDEVIIRIPDYGTDVQWTMAGLEYANTWSALQTFDATAGIQIGSTGVLITSDNDGAITFLGTSAGYDEDLTLNLDDTENTAVVSSSTGVTTIQFQGATSANAMNLATTGTILGAIKVIDMGSTAATYALTAPNSYGSMLRQTHDDGATTITLPDYQAAADVDHAKIGATVCVQTGTAYATVVNPAADDKIRTSNGTLNGAGVGVTGPATVSAYSCFILTDSAADVGHWSQMGMNGLWPVTP